MTHEMGRYWEQPNPSDIEVDGTHALMVKQTFDKLHEYSGTNPSGVYDGKMWKAERQIRQPNGSYKSTGIWFLRWYSACEDPTKCAINTRELIVI